MVGGGRGGGGGQQHDHFIAAGAVLDQICENNSN